MYPSCFVMTTSRIYKIFIPKLIAITTVFLVSAPNLISEVEPSAQLISTQTQSIGLAPTNSGGFKHLDFAFATTDANSATQVAETDRIVLHWHGNMPHYEVAGTAAGGTGAPRIAAQSTWSLKNTGERRALVINVARADGFAAPRDQVQGNYEEGARWIHHMSRGQISIKVEMFPRDVVVPFLTDPCFNSEGGFQTYGNNALEQVKRELPVNEYRFISFMLPIYENKHSLCAGGYGQVGHIYTWNFAFTRQGKTQAAPITTITHEWGHNVGLWHANMLFCSEGGQSVAFASSAARAAGACIPREYGSMYSKMGGAHEPSLTAGERQLIGWMSPGEQTTVSDATITLHRDGPVSLAWVRNSEGDIFQLEFVNERPRSPHNIYTWLNGFYDWRASVWREFVDLAEPFSHAGVLVKFTNKTGGANNSFVLDMNPQTSWVEDSPLRAQQSWTDPTGSVTITVINVVGDSASVHIRGQAVLPEAMPTVTLNPLPALGVVDVSWSKSTSLFAVSYEVRFFVGAEQRELHFVGVNTLQTRVQLTEAQWDTDYWVSVRAVSELGAGSPSALTPVRWGQTNKTCVSKKPAKRCK